MLIIISQKETDCGNTDNVICGDMNTLKITF